MAKFVFMVLGMNSRPNNISEMVKPLQHHTKSSDIKTFINTYFSTIKARKVYSAAAKLNHHQWKSNKSKYLTLNDIQHWMIGLKS